jgi:hypothetical protein
MNDGGNDTDNDKLEARNNVMTPNVDKNRDDN